MMAEDRIRQLAERARANHKRASDAYAVTDAQYHYFDKAYFLGRAHALEEALDSLEEDD